MTKDYKHEMAYRDDWKSLTGELPVKMTSDYLFRALLQADEKTLTAMVASLLHISVDEVTEIVITNLITLGESIDDKEFHLDVSAVINNSTKINMELQAVHLAGWTDRSLLYVCRSFDQLNHGELYENAMPVIQVSFTDFTLFSEEPEFYSTYKLCNVKNPKVCYTDKLVISNVDLTNIELATEEDIAWGIDKWARIFKANSWEELGMLAKDSTIVDRAVSSIWQLTEDEKIRDQIRRREENEREYNHVMSRAKKADELEKEIAGLEKIKIGLEEKNAGLEERNAGLEERNAGWEKRYAGLEEQNAELLKRIAQLEAQMAERN